MESKYLSAEITPQSLRGLVSEYPNYVPDNLAELEEARMISIPETLKKMEKETGSPCLNTSELTQLMEWKLKHGTFRPKLVQLVKENKDKDVIAITAQAFKCHRSSDITGSFQDAAEALSHLTKLKGVGLATASLVLSCYDQDNVPFFSDELFRWLHWERRAGKGWDRELKYTMKEYESLYEVIHSRLKDFERENDQKFTALELEKAAYVLGKRAAGLELENEEKDNDGRIPEKRQMRKRKTVEKEELDEKQSRSIRKKARSKKPESSTRSNGPSTY